MIKHKFRIRQASDFERIRRTGKVYKHPLLILIAAPNLLDHLRVGVVAGKGVGKAFQRNQVKRRIRACMAQYLPEIQGGWDIILIGRKPSASASYDHIQEALYNLLQRTGAQLSVSQQE